MAGSELDGKLAEARRTLRAIPGVVHVGFGYKQKAGVTTQQLCFRVYVREKKPLSAIPASEVIPSELLGIPTDVLIVPASSKLASCENVASYSPLVGGIGIADMKQFLAGTGDLHMGTLGFFATANGASGRDNIVLLTNNHVFANAGGVNGDRVYQPRLTETASGDVVMPPPDAQHPIGTIDNIGQQGQYAYTYDGDTAAGSYYVDCATAKIDTCFSSWCNCNCGVSFANSILGLAIGGSDAIEGVQRVRSQDLPSGGTYPVTKVGRTTGRTVGKIVDAAGTTTDSSSVDQTDVLLIENVGPNCGGGTVFADHGDSGSVIVNDDRKIVGLLYGGDTGAGTGHACHIHPVTDYLHITMVSSAHLAGASSAMAEVMATTEGGLAVARAAALREQIVTSAAGRAWRALVDAHRDEVFHLVNRVRPVTVAWHRLHGPDFLAHAIQAGRHADYAMPRELLGVQRNDALRQLFAVLRQHGSAPLRATIDAHADELLALLDAIDDLPGLAERLQPPAAMVRRSAAP